MGRGQRSGPVGEDTGADTERQERWAPRTCVCGSRSAVQCTLLNAPLRPSLACRDLQLVFNKGGKRIIQIVYLDDRVR